MYSGMWIKVSDAGFLENCNELVCWGFMKRTQDITVKMDYVE
jgi:hypothetical protein